MTTFDHHVLPGHSVAQHWAHLFRAITLRLAIISPNWYFPTCEMADQLGSAPFQPLFQSALEDYGKNTGVRLAQHPLAVDIQSCQSVDDITTLLQRRAQAFNDFQERDRMMRAIKVIVSILTPLSDVASLADAVGVVRQKALIACSTPLTSFFRHHSHLRKQYKLVLVYYWMYVPFSRPYVDIVVTSK
jgi:hypothetical protein